MKAEKWVVLGAMVFGTFLHSSIVRASTCAAPASMHPMIPGRVFSGDTTEGTEIGINLAGVVLPHPSVVYGFRSQEASGVFTMTGVDRVMVIAESCTSQPLAIGDANNPMQVPALTDGQNYLLIISTSPGLPPTNPPAGGPYEFGIPFLPVELQQFSVD